MPSGHAMHAGAMASFFATWSPWRSAVWSLFVGLASTRTVMLAHWPSGVAVGFAVGVLVEHSSRLIRRFRPRKPSLR